MNDVVILDLSKLKHFSGTEPGCSVKAPIKRYLLTQCVPLVLNKLNLWQNSGKEEYLMMRETRKVAVEKHSVRGSWGPILRKLGAEERTWHYKSC